MSKALSQYFVSSTPPAHITFFTSGCSLLFPEHPMYFHTTGPLFMLLALSGMSFLHLPTQKIPIHPSKSSSCWLFCEPRPSATPDRTICFLPSGPTASFLYYTISKLTRSGLINSERFWNRDVRSRQRQKKNPKNKTTTHTHKNKQKNNSKNKVWRLFGLSLIYSFSQYLLNAYCT